MKQTGSILLVFIMSFQFSVQLGIIAWFNLNKAYVAAYLCENRSVPESCCKGKCVLSKKLGGLEHTAPQAADISEKDLPLFTLPAGADTGVYLSAAERPIAVYLKRVSEGHLRKGIKPPESALL